LKGLIGKPDLDSVSTKLSRSQIQLKRAKKEKAGGAWGAHGRQSLVSKSTTDRRDCFGLYFQLGNMSNKSLAHT